MICQTLLMPLNINPLKKPFRHKLEENWPGLDCWGSEPLTFINNDDCHVGFIKYKLCSYHLNAEVRQKLGLKYEDGFFARKTFLPTRLIFLRVSLRWTITDFNGEYFLEFQWYFKYCTSITWKNPSDIKNLFHLNIGNLEMFKTMTKSQQGS